MVLIAGSVDNEIARAVKLGKSDFKFYIGKNIILFGYHIHHFYFGILLIAIAGWLSIRGSNKISKERLALLYGTGLGLLMDESGFLLTGGDYFTSLSYLLAIFLFGLFLSIIYFPPFWEKMRHYLLSGHSWLSSLATVLDRMSHCIAAYKATIIIVMVIVLCIDFLLRYLLYVIF